MVSALLLDTRRGISTVSSRLDMIRALSSARAMGLRFSRAISERQTSYISGTRSVPPLQVVT